MKLNLYVLKRYGTSLRIWTRSVKIRVPNRVYRRMNGAEVVSCPRRDLLSRGRLPFLTLETGDGVVSRLVRIVLPETLSGWTGPPLIGVKDSSQISVPVFFLSLLLSFLSSSTKNGTSSLKFPLFVPLDLSGSIVYL